MKKEVIIKSFWGLVVMSTTFLFLYFVGYNFKEFSGNIVMGVQTIETMRGNAPSTNQSIKTTLLTPEKKFLPIDNFEEGVFSVIEPGDLVEKTKPHTEFTIFNHYRAIPFKKSIDLNLTPKLKVEIKNEINTNAWIPIEIHKIDRNRNLVFFFLKTVEKEGEFPQYNFTGNYQLFFN